jgi:hypothetical protein
MKPFDPFQMKTNSTTRGLTAWRSSSLKQFFVLFENCA